MTTTSANIAGTIQPFGGPLKRQRAGSVYDMDEITPTGTKKKKKKKGVMELLFIDGEVMLEKKADKKYVVNGKRGVWRHIKGRARFIPDGESPSFAAKVEVPSAETA